MKLGQEIKYARLVKGIRQKYIADKLGLTAPAISFIECSKVFPTRLHLADICDILDLDFDEMMGKLLSEKGIGERIY